MVWEVWDVRRRMRKHWRAFRIGGEIKMKKNWAVPWLEGVLLKENIKMEESFFTLSDLPSKLHQLEDKGLQEVWIFADYLSQNLSGWDDNYWLIKYNIRKMIFLLSAWAITLLSWLWFMFLNILCLLNDGIWPCFITQVSTTTFVAQKRWKTFCMVNKWKGQLTQGSKLKIFNNIFHTF